MNRSVLPTSWVDKICPIYSVRTAVCQTEKGSGVYLHWVRALTVPMHPGLRGNLLPCHISILPTERHAVLHDTGVGTQQPKAGKWDARWRSCLRHFATSRKVAGSIRDGVTTNYQWYNPSGRSMALGLTQFLTEMSTRNILWGKGGRCVGLTPLLPSCADCLEIWAPETAGILRNSPSLYRVCCTFLSQENYLLKMAVCVEIVQGKCS